MQDLVKILLRTVTYICEHIYKYIYYLSITGIAGQSSICSLIVRRKPMKTRVYGEVVVVVFAYSNACRLRRLLTSMIVWTRALKAALIGRVVCRCPIQTRGDQ